MKKECVMQFSRQFLPLSFLDDSERQFVEIKERIGRLEVKNMSNSYEYECR
jgi:hypothetical protein